LYLDAALQVCYVAFGIYGWIKWNSTGADFPIQTWTLKTHVMWIGSGLILVVSLGWLADTFTAQQSPFVDATIFVFSLIATYMTAQKTLENWIYWIVIDAVAVGLFYSKDLYLTSVLYVFYTVLAVIGWMRWRTEINSKLP
jgi:nicotinamide mononucleotide transporter